VFGRWARYAWPSVNNGPLDQPMTLEHDMRYITSTKAANKIYMAPVSPWCELRMPCLFLKRPRAGLCLMVRLPVRGGSSQHPLRTRGVVQQELAVQERESVV
jgi:hypothetical protein